MYLETHFCACILSRSGPLPQVASELPVACWLLQSILCLHKKSQKKTGERSAIDLRGVGKETASYFIGRSLCHLADNSISGVLPEQNKTCWLRGSLQYFFVTQK